MSTLYFLCPIIFKAKPDTRMDAWVQMNDMTLQTYRVRSFSVDWHWDCVMACKNEKAFHCLAVDINRETNPDTCYLLSNDRYGPYTNLADRQYWNYYERHTGK